jgi:hypothetical protein
MNATPGILKLSAAYTRSSNPVRMRYVGSGYHWIFNSKIRDFFFLITAFGDPPH